MLGVRPSILMQLKIRSVQIWGLKMACRMFDKGHKDGGMQFTWCTRTTMTDNTAAFSTQSLPARYLFGINNFLGASGLTTCK
jgi:hypothetical protein